jgi:hypothetical protein
MKLGEDFFSGEYESAVSLITEARLPFCRMGAHQRNPWRWISGRGTAAGEED